MKLQGKPKGETGSAVWVRRQFISLYDIKFSFLSWFLSFLRSFCLFLGFFFLLRLFLNFLGRFFFLCCLCIYLLVFFCLFVFLLHIIFIIFLLNFIVWFTLHFSLCIFPSPSFTQFLSFHLLLVLAHFPFPCSLSIRFIALFFSYFIYPFSSSSFTYTLYLSICLSSRLSIFLFLLHPYFFPSLLLSSSLPLSNPSFSPTFQKLVRKSYTKTNERR